MPLTAFNPGLQGRKSLQGLQEFEAPAVEPRRGRMGQRIAVHPPGQNAGHITSAVSAGDTPSEVCIFLFREHQILGFSHLAHPPL